MQKIIPGIAIPGFEKRPLLFLDPGLRRDDGAKNRQAMRKNKKPK